MLHTDASGFAVSGVLSQDKGQGLQPIAFMSRKMNNAERNYPVHEQELLAIVASVEHWRWYLEGSPHPLVVYTDHKSIIHFNQQPTLSSRQVRWMEKLADFTFTPKYVQGANNAAADALSRRADIEEEAESERQRHQERAAAAPEGVHQRIRVVDDVQLNSSQVSPRTWELRFGAESQSLLDAIKKAAREDAVYQADLAQAARIGLYVADGLLWTDDGKCHVPDSRELKSRLLHLVHDTPVGGHVGRGKTLNRLLEAVWWSGISRDVADYVRSCIPCAAAKHSNQKPAGLLRPIPYPYRSWESISLDFVGPLPMTKNHHNMILTVVDRFTKMAHYIATSANVTAEKTAHLVIEHVVKLHGLPESIISDRGPQFTSGLWKELWRRLLIDPRQTTAWHPQGNGQAESLNRVVQDGLRIHADLRRDDWDEWLPLVEYAYNSAQNESTGYTPFEMNGQRVPSLLQLALSLPRRQHKVQGVQEMMDAMTDVWETARKRYVLRQAKQKEYADKSRREEKYAVGDRVLLSTENLGLHKGKLQDRFIGPFTVVEVPSGTNVKLNLPQEYARLHPTVHVERLKRYVPAALEWPGRQQIDRPLPELVDGQEEYEIEQLIGKREREVKVVVEEEVEPFESAAPPSVVEEVKEDEPRPRRSPRLRGGYTSTAPSKRVTRPRKPRVETRKVVEYLCLWKGYGAEEASWTAVDDLGHAQELVQEYELRQAAERGEDVVGLQYVMVVSVDAEKVLDVSAVSV